VRVQRGVYGRNTSAGLTVCVEEAAFLIVDDDITDVGKVHGVHQTVTVWDIGFTRRLTWHRAWQRSVVGQEFDVLII
jgi:hypothetical protein